jgi:hypothetical protein
MGTVVVRTATMASAATLASMLQGSWPDRKLFLCPLRAVTGVPCPLCGGTTAAVSLARFEPVDALAANPFAVVGAAAVALAPLIVLAGVRLRRWTRARAAAAALTVLAAELWQLARFGFI